MCLLFIRTIIRRTMVSIVSRTTQGCMFIILVIMVSGVVVVRLMGMFNIIVILSVLSVTCAMMRTNIRSSITGIRILWIIRAARVRMMILCCCGA